MRAARMFIDLMLLAILQLGIVFFLVPKASPQAHFFGTITYFAIAGLLQLVGEFTKRKGPGHGYILKTAAIGLVASTIIYALLYVILWIMAWWILGHPLE